MILAIIASGLLEIHGNGNQNGEQFRENKMEYSINRPKTLWEWKLKW